MLTYTGPKCIMTAKGNHDSGQSYEALDIVYDSISGNSYVSKIDVPPGIELSDETYWTLSANPSGAIAGLQADVSELKTDMSQAKTDITNKVNTSDVITNSDDLKSVTQIGKLVDATLVKGLYYRTADDVSYNNAISGLESLDVQSAIDELASKEVKITVDSELSLVSENPVQNKVITASLDKVKTGLIARENGATIRNLINRLCTADNFPYDGCEHNIHVDIGSEEYTGYATRISTDWIVGYISQIREYGKAYSFNRQFSTNTDANVFETSSNILSKKELSAITVMSHGYGIGFYIPITTPYKNVQINSFQVLGPQGWVADNATISSIIGFDMNKYICITPGNLSVYPDFNANKNMACQINMTLS